ncbi:MAG: hypothetical protein K2I47_01425 [Odoribacter sp.]|nr:hypothetical protein [Odoribacter sp.]
MAIFESTLFHRLRNSLGNVVTYTYCGKGVLRGKPLYVRNPRTPAQQEVRLRFKSSGRLSAYFRKAALLGFPASYAVQSHNAFVGANLSIFDVDDKGQVRPDFRRLVCSRGKLEKPAVTLHISGDEIRAEVSEQPLSAYSSRTDSIYAVLWDCQYPGCSIVKIGKRQGGYTTAPFSCPDEFDLSHLFIYAFAVSANGKQASDTLLLLAEGENV